MKKLLRAFGLAKGTRSNTPENAEDLRARREAHNAAVAERMERIDAAIEEADALFEAKAKADYEAFEKPTAKYRIKRYEYTAEHSGVALPSYVKSDGYYVETWHIRQHGYELVSSYSEGYYTHELRLLSISDAAMENAFASIKRQYAMRLEDAVTDIVWKPVGISNPFSTFEEAQEWLHKWLQPETQVAEYDAEGNWIETDASAA